MEFPSKVHQWIRQRRSKPRKISRKQIVSTVSDEYQKWQDSTSSSLLLEHTQVQSGDRKSMFGNGPDLKNNNYVLLPFDITNQDFDDVSRHYEEMASLYSRKSLVLEQAGHFNDLDKEDNPIQKTGENMNYSLDNNIDFDEGAGIDQNKNNQNFEWQGTPVYSSIDERIVEGAESNPLWFSESPPPLLSPYKKPYLPPDHKTSTLTIEYKKQSILLPVLPPVLPPDHGKPVLPPHQNRPKLPPRYKGYRKRCLKHRVKLKRAVEAKGYNNEMNNTMTNERIGEYGAESDSLLDDNFKAKEFLPMHPASLWNTRTSVVRPEKPQRLFKRITTDPVPWPDAVGSIDAVVRQAAGSKRLTKDVDDLTMSDTRRRHDVISPSRTQRSLGYFDDTTPVMTSWSDEGDYESVTSFCGLDIIKPALYSLARRTESNKYEKNFVGKNIHKREENLTKQTWDKMQCMANCGSGSEGNTVMLMPENIKLYYCQDESRHYETINDFTYVEKYSDAKKEEERRKCALQYGFQRRQLDGSGYSNETVRMVKTCCKLENILSDETISLTPHGHLLNFNERPIQTQLRTIFKLHDKGDFTRLKHFQRGVSQTAVSNYNIHDNYEESKQESLKSDSEVFCRVIFSKNRASKITSTEIAESVRSKDLPIDPDPNSVNQIVARNALPTEKLSPIKISTSHDDKQPKVKILQTPPRTLSTKQLCVSSWKVKSYMALPTHTPPKTDKATPLHARCSSLRNTKALARRKKVLRRQANTTKRFGLYLEPDPHARDIYKHLGLINEADQMFLAKLDFIFNQPSEEMVTVIKDNESHNVGISKEIIFTEKYPKEDSKGRRYNIAQHNAKMTILKNERKTRRTVQKSAKNNTEILQSKGHDPKARCNNKYENVSFSSKKISSLLKSDDHVFENESDCSGKQNCPTVNLNDGIHNLNESKKSSTVHCNTSMTKTVFDNKSQTPKTMTYTDSNIPRRSSRRRVRFSPVAIYCCTDKRVRNSLSPAQE